MQEILNWLSQPWPWYVSGPLIGLMVPLLLIFGNVHFGLSSSFRQICSACIPSNASYFKDYDWKGGMWRFIFVIGIILGGFISTNYLSFNQPLDLSANTISDLKALGLTDFSQYIPVEIFSWEALQTTRGIVFMVLGGFLVGFGVRYANGCTSGHAIMGLSLLSVGSLVAVIGFFAGGLIVTHLLLPLFMNL